MLSECWNTRFSHSLSVSSATEAVVIKISRLFALKTVKTCSRLKLQKKTYSIFSNFIKLLFALSLNICKGLVFLIVHKLYNHLKAPLFTQNSDSQLMLCGERLLRRQRWLIQNCSKAPHTQSVKTFQFEINWALVLLDCFVQNGNFLFGHESLVVAGEI